MSLLSTYWRHHIYLFIFAFAPSILIVCLFVNLELVLVFGNVFSGYSSLILNQFFPL